MTWVFINNRHPGRPMAKRHRSQGNVYIKKKTPVSSATYRRSVSCQRSHLQQQPRRQTVNVQLSTSITRRYRHSSHSRHPIVGRHVVCQDQAMPKSAFSTTKYQPHRPNTVAQLSLTGPGSPPPDSHLVGGHSVVETHRHTTHCTPPRNVPKTPGIR